ncbi:ATP-binding protein [Actinoplanes sp. NPDC051494]|uniref:ATP-binding protein n=1 Tax=Actinoplanes sp. NPDC051494 TaxID=3363907 RepID=UPI0037B9241F
MTPPDPGRETTLDGLAACLRELKQWAGNPSYETITGRVNAARAATDQVGKTTVVDCFRAGRRRMDGELVAAVVTSLHPDDGYVFQWRQALRVAGGEIRAAAQVRVRGELPPDLPGFTGREAELARIGQAVSGDGTAVISALEGMAGVGKTQLAIHVGHALAAERAFDRVLFVNLRGFHPDPAQPPADPAAVLDGFLRLLGVSGHQVPYPLGERVAAYRDRLAGLRVLVVLDNAADEEQVRPLLPGTPGCVTLVTSRRGLAGLDAAAHFDVDVFTPAESLRFLASAMPGIPAGEDLGAAERIAARCGHLPLALALIAGHLRARPGWSLTDHADRLDELHRDRRLDSGVELALDVSYRNLPAGERELLRLLAQHPGQDADVLVAAALSGTGPDLAGERLGKLVGDHLVQPAGPGRYALHDLVRSFAVARAADEDRRAGRRAALTRMLDFYLAASVEAMNRLDPADAARRPKIGSSALTLPGPGEPIVWLDAERANLVAMVTFAAEQGWPGHSVDLAATLFRYFLGGHHLDALTVHGRAAEAAERSGDPGGQAGALANMSTAEVFLGRHESALAHLEQARKIFRRSGDGPGQARTLNNLGVVETRLGHYAAAARHLAESMELHERSADEAGQARALTNLANLESRLGRDEDALPHYAAALRLHQSLGDRNGEAVLLSNLGGAEVKLGRFDDAERHLTRALELDRELRNAAYEASTLDFFGTLYVGRGDAERAAGYHREAMALFTKLGDRHGESCAHNGLGEAARVAGRAAEAAVEHDAAWLIAVDPDIADIEQQARAQSGLAEAHRMLGDLPESERHEALARELWAGLLGEQQ